MTLFPSIVRAAAPAFVVAIMLAGCANTGETVKTPSNSRDAVLDFASCAKPIYPSAAVKEQRTGTVKLGFLVNTDGAVEDSRVERSSGHDDLDQAAREGIKLCKFMPAIRDGKHAKEWVRVQYVWTLK
jgi:bla regulator protein BlaR1